MTEIKICGLKESDSLIASIEAGARFIGLNFYPPSPRYVDFDQAFSLCQNIPNHVRKVGLFVDPDDAILEQALAGVDLNMIQLHGHESPGRIAEIKQKFSRPIIKAISISDAADLEKIPGYEAVSDWLMFDTKAAPDASLPGGNGQIFDWSLLKDLQTSRPWFLAGGLNAGNIAEALSVLSPDAVDISSGVETAPGQKDAGKIKEFIEAVQATD